MRLSFDASWNTADAALEPFRLPGGEAFAAARPHQSYDFSQAHLWSDLDTEYLEAGFRGRWRLSPDVYLSATYRYVDFDDKAPYLGDDSGSVDFYGVGIVRSF